MTATCRRPRTTKIAKTASTPARPVTELLLEIAYHLHTTRVVGRRPAPRRPVCNALPA